MGPRPFGKLCEAACHSGTMRESAPGAASRYQSKRNSRCEARRKFWAGPKKFRSFHGRSSRSTDWSSRGAGFIEEGRQRTAGVFHVLACFHLTEFGLPSAEEMESMDKFEDALASSLEGSQTAHLMVILTGDSERDWLWYTRGEEEAMAR